MRNRLRQKLDERVHRVEDVIKKACEQLLPRCIDRYELNCEAAEHPMMYPLTDAIVETALISVDIDLWMGDEYTAIGMTYSDRWPLDDVAKEFVLTSVRWAIDQHFNKD